MVVAAEDTPLSCFAMFVVAMQFVCLSNGKQTLNCSSFKFKNRFFIKTNNDCHHHHLPISTLLSFNTHDTLYTDVNVVL